MLSPLLLVLAGACADAGAPSAQSAEFDDKRSRRDIRTDVNFAVGGAATNSTNATDTFAIFNEELAGIIALLRTSGLDLIGLQQQLDFATATLNDVSSQLDVFWVYAGTNNYLSGLLTGTLPAPAEPAGEIGAALERLYSEVGARRFVVPNLPNIADLPLVSQNPALAGFLGPLTQLTVDHNTALAAEIADFVAAHPDVEVVSPDVFEIFQDHKDSGEFANTTQACSEVKAGEDLEDPATCEGFLYLDTVHPRSSSWAPVAAAIDEDLSNQRVRRIITVGDSFSDLGSLSDTFNRGLPFPFVFPQPPFTEGRFTEAENVIQQFEELRRVPVRSTFFAQPLRTTETLGQTSAETTLAMSGSVIVPKQLSATGAEDCTYISLDFGDNLFCWFEPDAGDSFVNTGCSAFRSVAGGSRIDAEEIKVFPGDITARRLEPCEVDSLTIDWLHY